MSKLSNGFILRAIWHAVLKQLPVRVTHNYFGDGNSSEPMQKRLVLVTQQHPDLHDWPSAFIRTATKR